jgi:hypothetical protein
MKSEERLLADVLRAGDYEDFQESVRHSMVTAARANKAGRRNRQLLAMAASLAVLGTAMFWAGYGESASKETRAQVTIVRTKPMAMGMMVRTGSQLEVVRSAPSATQFETGLEPIATITDQQLLNLFKDRPVALVRIEGEMRLLISHDMREIERQ